MDRPRPVLSTRAAAGAVLFALALSACTDDADEPATTATGGASTAAVATDVAQTTAAAPTMAAPPTTAAVPTSVAVPTTVAAPTTAAPVTTATPTTAAPATLALARDGLVVAPFGTEADAAVAAVTEALGAPTEDTGWVDPLTISTCAGTELRRVSWGVLSMLFGDPAAAGARVFFAYAYGDVSQLGGQPAGLLTPEGLGLGMLVADLRVAYPAVTTNAGEEGLVESSFFVDDALAGLLTGATDTDSVTVIFGGPFCG